MPALNVYGLSSASSTLSTASKFASTTGGSNTNVTTKIGTSTGYGEIYSLGNTGAWGAGGSIGSASGHGSLWDVTTLEGNTIAAGNWTPFVKLSVSAGSITADIYVRVYVYSGGTYTQIGSNMVLASQTINTTATIFSFSGTSQPAQAFTTGNKLYADCWLNIKTNSTGSGTATVTTALSSSASAGLANHFEIDTPGYSSSGSTQVTKDIPYRSNIGYPGVHDLVYRANLFNATGLLSGGFGLWANGTGTASFDHFRVTQYPDPSLSCMAVTPRAGSTLVAWQANTPTNTSLAIATSVDGVNFTDVSSQNGGAIPNMFPQPSPTVDGFSANTSGNYTNTFQTGGSVATWTWDTTNSRLIGTGGLAAILVNSSLSHTDMDVLVDLDESDAGGIVFDYVDQSDFYVLVIHDNQASVGTPNQVVLTKVAAGTPSTLATASISFPRGTYHRFHVTMLSGVITASMDGTQVLTYTDASPLNAGLAGVYNSGGTSRYYSLWITPQGDYVTGTPSGDMVTGRFVYTKATLTSTDPTQTPQLFDLETFVGSPSLGIGTLIPSVQYQRTFVSSNLDDLAKQSNYSWYFTPSGLLVFNGRQAAPAPWILSSNALALPSDLEMDTNLYVEVMGDLYRNRQTLTNVLTTTVFTNTFAGDNSRTSFTLAYKIAYGTIPTITLNGQTQTVGTKGSSGSQWYYAPNDATLAQDSSGAKLQVTDTLSVTYTGISTTDVIADNTTAQAALAALEGGSGIVEAVEDVSKKSMVYSAATTYAQQLLTRFCVTGRTLVFRTYRNGLQIGQLLTCMFPEMNLQDVNLLITGVDIQMQTQPNNTVLYHYLVTATELPNAKSWGALLSSSLLSTDGSLTDQTGRPH